MSKKRIIIIATVTILILVIGAIMVFSFITNQRDFEDYNEDPGIKFEREGDAVINDESKVIEINTLIDECELSSDSVSKEVLKEQEWTYSEPENYYYCIFYYDGAMHSANLDPNKKYIEIY